MSDIWIGFARGFMLGLVVGVAIGWWHLRLYHQSVMRILTNRLPPRRASVRLYASNQPSDQ